MILSCIFYIYHAKYRILQLVFAHKRQDQVVMILSIAIIDIQHPTWYPNMSLHEYVLVVKVIMSAVMTHMFITPCGLLARNVYIRTTCVPRFADAIQKYKGYSV